MQKGKSCEEYLSALTMVVTEHIFWVNLQFSVVLDLHVQPNTNIISTFRV